MPACEYIQYSSFSLVVLQSFVYAVYTAKNFCWTTYIIILYSMFELTGKHPLYVYLCYYCAISSTIRVMLLYYIYIMTYNLCLHNIPVGRDAIITIYSCHLHNIRTRVINIKWIRWKLSKEKYRGKKISGRKKLTWKELNK